jgi:hypothetical protein
VTPDNEGAEDPFIGIGDREMGSTPLRDAQQVLEMSAAVAMVSSSSLRESGPLPKKVHTKGCLPPSTQYVHVECHEPFHSLLPLVSELGIRRFLSRKRTLGALNFCRSVARPEPPMPSSLSKNVWVETSRVAREEGIMSEVLTWGNTVETSALMGATGASVSPRADGDRRNEVRPQPVGASGRAALSFGSSRGTNSSPSWKVTVGDTLPSPGSSDVVALGNEELGLVGFP